MQVGFLIHGLDVSSCRYRVLQYLPYLKDHGIETSVLFYPRTWFARVQFPRLLTELDLLYIHRKLFHPLEFWLIRKKARKVIYDFDDALMYRSCRGVLIRSRDAPNSLTWRDGWTRWWRGISFYNRKHSHITPMWKSFPLPSISRIMES